ncbi:MAG: hypothetical protein J6P73_03815 [Bacteroidales bacterium]|nr:hypothetical protein [Bacteroidales bacterium]
METTQPVKRPVGMTFLLVLSILNACLQIFSNLFMYITMPVMKTMTDNGELEDAFAPFFSMIDESMVENFNSTIEVWMNVPPYYFLITGLLFVGSLVGAVKMLRLQRLGFHIYSISQMLILIVAVAFVYSHMPQNPFFSVFLTTVMFILIYHLYFKRIENDPTTKKEQDIRPEA